jgi:hypothetical protein
MKAQIFRIFGNETKRHIISWKFYIFGNTAGAHSGLAIYNSIAASQITLLLLHYEVQNAEVLGEIYFSLLLESTPRVKNAEFLDVEESGAYSYNSRINIPGRGVEKTT